MYFLSNNIDQNTSSCEIYVVLLSLTLFGDWNLDCFEYLALKTANIFSGDCKGLENFYDYIPSKKRESKDSA
jgi:hypothetical protein